MAVVFSNNAATNLASNVSASATTISVVDGSVFPDVSGGHHTYLTLHDLNDNIEIVKLTARSGNTLTVDRGHDGTTGRSFVVGDKCELRITAVLLNEIASQADTDTNTEYTAGSGLDLSGTTFTNTSPDQTVSLTGSGATTISGTYPNFTISSTDNNTVYTHPSAHSISFITGLQTALDEKVDDSQVLTNVPSGAVFTDTVYTLPFTDNSSNWNTAYGWGNHASAGYLTSYTETDTLSSVTGRGATTSANISATSFSGNVYGASTGAPDSTIWAISRDQYPTYGIFYDEGNPDKILYKWAGATKFNINMETGALDTPSTITASGGNSGQWNTAYGWGDHGSAGYLTSHQSLSGYATETYVGTQITNLVDSSPAHLNTLGELATAIGNNASGVTALTNSIATKWTQDNTKISQWDTAYGWGDHGTQGYLTNATLPAYPSVGNGTLTVTAGTSLSGGGSFTANQSGNSSVTLNIDTPPDAGGGGWYDVVAWNNALVKDTSVALHGAGYLRAVYLNMSHGVGTRSSDTVFYSSTDDYIRKTNATGMRSSLDVYNKSEVNALIPSVPSVGNGTLTINTSGSASGGGTFTANQSGNNTITITGATIPTSLPANGGNADTVDNMHFYNQLGVGERIDFSVGGDAATYYPVVITGGGGSVVTDFQIYRGYSETAPSSWGSSTHFGGLAFKYKITGSSGWGGHPTSIRVEEFGEIYRRILGGIAFTAHTMKHVVWLRGGTATYHIWSNADISIEVNDSTSASNYVSASPHKWYSYDHSNAAYDVTVSERTSAEANTGVANEVYINMPVSYNSAGTPSVYGIATSAFNHKFWNSSNDGSGSGLDADLLDGQHGSYYAPASSIPTTLPANGGNADTVDSLHASSFARSDASDTIGNGVQWHWASTDTAGLKFTNNSYGKSLQIGGWDGTATSGVSKIRNSNDNLHLDSGSAGNLYLNHYAGGGVYANGHRVWSDGYAGTYNYNNLSNKPTIPTIPSSLPANGGNADTVDNLHAASFLRSDASDTASQRITFSANATNNWDTIATSSGSQGAFEVYNGGVGNDAFMTFHAGNDYAMYFGLDADSNKLAVGGWSMGASKYAIYHEGNKPTLSELGYSAPSIGNGTLTINTSGSASGGGTFSANQSGNNTITITGATIPTSLPANGGNADTLDSLDSTKFTYYRGTVSGDWNTIFTTASNQLQTSGLYQVNNLTSGHSNHPTGVYTYGGVFAWNLTNHTFKLYSSHTGDLSFQSGWNNDEYSGWRRILTSSYYGSAWTSSNDGSGSGLDADLLDGQHGSYYQNASNINSGTLNTARLPSAITVSGNIRTTAGALQFTSANHQLTSYNANNVLMKSGTTSAMGLLGQNSSDQFRWQLYGDGSYYGFLDGNWASWDLKKQINGAFQVDEGSGLKRVLNEANWSSYITIPSSLPANGGNADTVDGFHAATHGSNIVIRTHSNGYLQPENWIKPANGTGLFYQAGVHFYESGNKMYSSTSFFSAVQGTLWGSSNDGSGSGLDADLLDGQHGSYYRPASQTTTLTGAVTGSGTTSISTSNPYQTSVNFSTNGPDNAMEYQQLSGVSDTKISPSGDWYNSIRMGHGDPYNYYGNTIAVKMTGTQVGTLYTQTISSGTAQGWNKHWHNNNDGASSGLDADLLDGQHGSYYLNYNNFSNTPSIPSVGNGTLTINTSGSASGGGTFTANQSGNSTITINGTGITSYTETDTLNTVTGRGSTTSNNVDFGKVLVGGSYSNNSYNTVSSTRLLFGGGNDQDNYFIGTNLENYGGNYTKLDLRWHTGIRMGAQPNYGGVRIFNNEDLSSVLFSVGKGDGHTRVESGNLYFSGGTSNIAWHAGNDGAGSGLDADLLDGQHGSYYYQASNPSGYLRNASSEVISYVYRIHASDSTTPDSFGYDNRYQTFNYGVSSGIVGPLITFGGLGSGYPMQLTGQYNGSGTNIKYRTRNGDTGSWNSWYTLWHAGNDGSGSSLDADLLDGQHGSYYAPASSIPVVGTANINIVAGTGLTGGGSFSANQSNNTTITLNATGSGGSGGTSEIKTATIALTKAQIIANHGSTQGTILSGESGKIKIPLEAMFAVSGTATINSHANLVTFELRSFGGRNTTVAVFPAQHMRYSLSNGVRIWNRDVPLSVGREFQPNRDITVHLQNSSIPSGFSSTPFEKITIILKYMEFNTSDYAH